jgi:two-component system response regulator CssR
MIKRTYTNDYDIFKVSDYKIDIKKRIVLFEEKEIKLTSLEFDLLEIFLNNLGYSLNRDSILNKLYGTNYYGNDRNVDELIRRLRKKLKNIKIETIYGFGYRLTK